MSDLRIEGLRAGVDGFEILHGIDLLVRSGEVHALMGPNGSGKSTLAHVLMGRADYTVTAGSVTLDRVELLGLPVWRRAQLGLFLAMQHPVEVPGVAVGSLLQAAAAAAERERGGPVGAVPVGPELAVEAARLEVRGELLVRGVNDEFCGGERKRMETLQLAVLAPRFAILDEIDSGLDVDALRDISRRIEAMTREQDLGVLAITHYSRLLRELRPDFVHVIMGGRVVTSGGPELADELETSGYEGLAARLGVETLAVARPAPADPFATPGF